MKTLDPGKTGVLQWQPGLHISQIANTDFGKDVDYELGAIAWAANKIAHSLNKVVQLAAASHVIGTSAREVIAVFSMATYAYRIDDLGEMQRSDRGDIIAARFTAQPSADPDGCHSYQLVKDSDYCVIDASDPARIAVAIQQAIHLEMKDDDNYSIFRVTKSVPTEVKGWSEWTI